MSNSCTMKISDDSEPKIKRPRKTLSNSIDHPETEPIVDSLQLPDASLVQKEDNCSIQGPSMLISDDSRLNPHMTQGDASLPDESTIDTSKERNRLIVKLLNESLENYRKLDRELNEKRALIEKRQEDLIYMKARLKILIEQRQTVTRALRQMRNELINQIEKEE